ncbi:nucleosome assembly protein 1-like 1 [Scyliorhinus canicula]|uniref:nucleosome assembly protein 1-like 1 n=1 Tax=Scyliorhinus canicula TaxID=7830 RepID=UPI0018F5AA04|nr:nucleosome assembly protein 1-like 1 [Scyliorhinus canicula]
MAQLPNEIQAKVKMEEDKPNEEMEVSKGIPQFWLTVFKNVELLSGIILEHDEPIVKHLQNVNRKFSEPGQPMSFTLEFKFEPIEYFTNEAVTKAYQTESQPDELDILFFDEPEITGCTGCQINWKKEINATLKTIKTKLKHKGRGTSRTVTKTVPNDSFFIFFSPPVVPQYEELDESSAARFAADFVIGHFLREHIVPRAMLYFTAEAIGDDD